jgi:nitrate/nitrite-specific signal transduction histidine kinase
MAPRSLSTRLTEHAETLAILLRSGACAEKPDSATLVTPSPDGYGLTVGQVRDLVTTLRETIAQLNLPSAVETQNASYPIAQRETDDAPSSTSR